MRRRQWNTYVPLSIFTFLLITTLTACNSTKNSSPAFEFGEATGKKWRELSDEVNVISEWVSQNTSASDEIPEVDKLSACRAMWIIVGLPQFGLKDMAKNREDFIEGCSTTVGK